jgi:O-acetyl-ADP-ribose deacetylase (regulator of RNase III)
MLYEVEGDILLTEAQAIGHGVAPNDDFKQGLALSLREGHPELYKEFRHEMHQKHMPEGTLWKWTGADGKCVYNLFTQEHSHGHGSKPGKAKTSYVNHSLKDLRKAIEDEAIASLALPKIATGVGGLDWEEVKPLIEKHLGDLNIPIYIYTQFTKGKKAQEPKA